MQYNNYNYSLMSSLVFSDINYLLLYHYVAIAIKLGSKAKLLLLYLYLTGGPVILLPVLYSKYVYTKIITKKRT